MRLSETTVALLLSDEGRQVLQSAAVSLAENPFLLVFVKESDDIGMWIRVSREDGDHLLLIRWEYVLSMDVPEGTPKILGLR